MVKGGVELSCPVDGNWIGIYIALNDVIRNEIAQF